VPIDETLVKIYSCGPTVYDYAHIGNMRSFVLADLVARVLHWNNYLVKQVINITDVGHLTDNADKGEDKIEQIAKKTGLTIKEVTTPFIDQFFLDLKALNIKTENIIFPKATDYIDKQIQAITILEQKGYTYTTTDGVYFDISKYPAYADFAKLNLTEQNPDLDRNDLTNKRQPADFALWKFSNPKDNRLQEWPSPWGVGFPGWHLECSVMSMDLLGSHFDIHTGGEDHIPVHHTNEKAQSECLSGGPFVNYWLHNAFITVNGDKMSKSKNNFYTISSLIEQNFNPLSYRYFLLSGHYRSPLNFSFEALKGAEITRAKINQQFFDLPEGGKPDLGSVTDFTAMINDDMNTAKALAKLHEVLASNLPEKTKRATISKFDEILGILDKSKPKINPIPEELISLTEDREIARNRGDFKHADLIRAQIEAKGYTIKDTSTGPKLSQK